MSNALVLEAAVHFHLPVVEMLVLKDTYKQHQEKFQDLEILIRLYNCIYHQTGW